MSGQKHGQVFETAINRQHREYSRAGRAWCWHTMPPFILQQRLKGGRFVGRLMGEAPPDYLVVADGRLYMIEAKSFKGPRFPWANVKPHQARALAAIDAHASGWLLIRSVQFGEVAAIRWDRIAPDWDEWRSHKATNQRAPVGSASIAWGELRGRASVVLKWPNCDYLAVLDV
tara:strand:- start:106 stop:624 length:519 start_codon:yes stop_codon:yes gene_type:complete